MSFYTEQQKISEAYRYMLMRRIFESAPQDIATTVYAAQGETPPQYELDKIFNEDCLTTMGEHIAPNSVDIILTSPPYCTSNRASKSVNNLSRAKSSNPKRYPSMRYDEYSDNMSMEEYLKWTVKLFQSFDRILKKDGVIIYNISYSNARTELPERVVIKVGDETNFTKVDTISWIKNTAMPNNVSSNRLTRLVEPVFIFCRKGEENTFMSNKRVTSVRKNGQKMYTSFPNYIMAKNNNGVSKLNRATFSEDLCTQLLEWYARQDDNGDRYGLVVYDPFSGSGTTAATCRRLGMRYIGSEISKAQVEQSINRIAAVEPIGGGRNRFDGSRNHQTLQQMTFTFD